MKTLYSQVTEKEATKDEAIVQRFYTGNFPQITKEAYEEALKHVPAHPSREESIAEAVGRMKTLGFSSYIIEDFKKSGTINQVMDDGYFYPLTKSDREHIQILEEKGYIVYAAISSHTLESFMTSYILVHNQSSKWIFEQNNLKYNALFAYVYNHDAPYDTEYGNIIFKHMPGGTLLRIY